MTLGAAPARTGAIGIVTVPSRAGHRATSGGEMSALAFGSPSALGSRASRAPGARRGARARRFPRARPSAPPSAPRASSSSSSSTDASATGPLRSPRLIVIECDGVLCDVHLDGHREAFNETFRDLGMEGMSWSVDEYLSLLRSGGGTAHGMLERYFAFYGYPTADLRGVDDLPPAWAMDGAPPPDGAEAELDTIDGLGVPEGYEDATPAVRRAAAHAARSRDPTNASILAEKRAAWIDDVVARKDAAFESIVRGGRLKLRKGALEFLDECLLEDGASVVIIGATASAPEEGVLDAVLTAVGPLRAAAVAAMGSGEALDAADLNKNRGDDELHAPPLDEEETDTDNTVVAEVPGALRRASSHRDLTDDELDGFGDHSRVHDASWEEARARMAHAMRARKGELLADEIGGDLRRQSFDSNVIVDTSVFCTSTRSAINASALLGLLESKGVRREEAAFVGASRATCAEANQAGVFNVVCRTANQADSQVVGVACVCDDFGGGGGLTLRLLKHRMAAWKGETVGGREI